MDKKELIKRYLFFLLGLFVNSFGVSFVTKANLGTSPISSIPYTLSIGFKPSLGMFTLYMSIILIAVQLILLRKKFPRQYFLQIPVSILFSYFIDLTMYLLRDMNPSAYYIKVIFLLAGCLILGTGVFMEMVANVVMLPGESFVNAVSKTFHTDFGKTKIAFDSSMTVIAGIIGLVLYHRLAGVREGTVVAAILVGAIARFLKRKIGFIEELWLIGSPGRKDVLPDGQTDISKSHNAVITVSRQFGSGGRRIAGKIAETLGFTLHDKDILDYAAKNTKLEEQFVEKEDQKLTSSLLYDLMAQVYDMSEETAKQERIFQSQKKAIEEYAAAGNCVIVGRCADWILRDKPNCIHIFLHADEDKKIEEIQRRNQTDRKEAGKLVKEINRERATHYSYFTGRSWGDSANYDLSVDTGTFSEEQIVGIVKQLALQNMKKYTCKY